MKLANELVDICKWDIGNKIVDSFEAQCKLYYDSNSIFMFIYISFIY